MGEVIDIRKHIEARRHKSGLEAEQLNLRQALHIIQDNLVEVLKMLQDERGREPDAHAELVRRAQHLLELLHYGYRMLREFT